MYAIAKAILPYNHLLTEHPDTRSLLHPPAIVIAIWLYVLPTKTDYVVKTNFDGLT